KAASYTLTASTSAGSFTAVSGSFTIAAGAAAKLAFDQQPGNATAGTAISPAVTVLVQDAHANNVTSATNAIALAIATNPGSATLSGTLSADAVGGTASFSTLAIDKVGSGYTLSAASSGLTGATSTAFAITPGPLHRIVLSPGTSTVTLGASQSFTAEGFDAFNNSRGDVTSATTFSAGLGASCTGASCTSEAPGSYTVTGTNGTVTATASLTVNAASSGAAPVSNTISTGGSITGLTTSTGSTINVTVPSGLPAMSIIYQSQTGLGSTPAPSAGYAVAGSVFTFTALDGTGALVHTFASPLTLTITPSATDLATVGGDISKLDLAYFDTSSSSWRALGCSVQGSTLVCSTTHFTQFAVVTLPPPASSGGGGGTPGDPSLPAALSSLTPGAALYPASQAVTPDLLWAPAPVSVSAALPVSYGGVVVAGNVGISVPPQALAGLSPTNSITVQVAAQPANIGVPGGPVQFSPNGTIADISIKDPSGQPLTTFPAPI